MELCPTQPARRTMFLLITNQLKKLQAPSIYSQVCLGTVFEVGLNTTEVINIDR
jgi:hypothetical protein